MGIDLDKIKKTVNVDLNVGQIIYGILGLVIIFVLIGWLSNTFPRQSIVDGIVKQTKEQIEKDTKKQLEEKQSEIDKLVNDLKLSQDESESLKIKYEKLKGEYNRVKPPKTTKETVDRFNNLGYPSSVR